jgi:hypothetical protein
MHLRSSVSAFRLKIDSHSRRQIHGGCTSRPNDRCRLIAVSNCSDCECDRALTMRNVAVKSLLNYFLITVNGLCVCCHVMVLWARSCCCPAAAHRPGRTVRAECYRWRCCRRSCRGTAATTSGGSTIASRARAGVSASAATAAVCTTLVQGCS